MHIHFIYTYHICSYMYTHTPFIPDFWWVLIYKTQPCLSQTIVNLFTALSTFKGSAGHCCGQATVECTVCFEDA